MVDNPLVAVSKPAEEVWEQDFNVSMQLRLPRPMPKVLRDQSGGYVLSTSVVFFHAVAPGWRGLSVGEVAVLPPGEVVLGSGGRVWLRDAMWAVGLPKVFTGRIVAEGVRILGRRAGVVAVPGAATEVVRGFQEKGAGVFLDWMESYGLRLFKGGIGVKEDVEALRKWVQGLKKMGYGVARNRNDRVAVCVSGQLRSLDMKLSDPGHSGNWYKMQSKLPPPSMTVAESVSKNLYPLLEDVDVFMVISTKEGIHEPQEGDQKACESLRPPKGHLHCEIKREAAVEISKRDMWENMSLHKNRGHLGDVVIQGLLQQLKGLFQCHQAILKHSISTGKKYDWMVRLRPDDYIHSFPSLQRLDADTSRPTIWYGSFDSCCCGNIDRFAIARSEWLQVYFDRFLHLQQVDWGHYNLTKDAKLWKAETFLSSLMRNYGISLRAHPLIKLCVVKPNYRRNPSDA